MLSVTFIYIFGKFIGQEVVLISLKLPAPAIESVSDLFHMWRQRQNQYSTLPSICLHPSPLEGVAGGGTGQMVGWESVIF